MTRSVVLGALIASCGISVAAARHQGRANQDEPKVAKVEKVKDNLYILIGGGGNTGVFITENGVVVIDTKVKGWGQEILSKVRTLTPKPVTMIINTHNHADHTGSNTEFPATIDFVAHENARTNLAKETCTPLGNCQSFKGDNAKYLPKKTFKDRMTLLSGKDRIDLYYFGRGHTNNDTVVVFPALRAMHIGDLFARKAVPNIMPADGGSATEHPKTLARVVAGLKDVDAVITGHSTVMTWKELQEFTEFDHEFVENVQEAMKAGKSADQAAAALKMPEKYKDYTIVPAKVRENVGYIYDELHLSGHYSR